MTSAERAAEEVARTSYGRLVAYLASSTGDLAAAEDALGDAFVAALRTWPVQGVPARPDSWLVTAARRRLIDAARRRDTAGRALADVAMVLEERAAPPPVDAVPDRRLGLLFACAHPAVDPAARCPLMLQAVLGLDAARIAEAFLVAPAAMGQRLVRAKARLKRAGVPFAVPPLDALPARLEAVLDAVYAAYTAGWDDPLGARPRTEGLTAEAVRLARLLVELVPGEPEARGLLALLLHLEARAAARRVGGFVPLEDQDVGRWDGASMAEAEEELLRARSLRRLGPYQLQAAIQSVHARRALTGTTDWAALTALYDGLVALAPTVGALVARAAAYRRADGAARALALVEQIPADRVAAYQPYWVLRARCLSDLGRPADASVERALALTEDRDVRAHLARTLPLRG